MHDEHNRQGDRGAAQDDRGGVAQHDPFVALLRWLARAHGGLDVLAAKSGIGLRTLQDWHHGRYPRKRQSPKVRQLHEWALRNDSTYPPDWAPHGGLSDLAGPARIQVGGLTDPTSAAGVRAADPQCADAVELASDGPTGARPGTPRRPRWIRKVFGPYWD